MNRFALVLVWLLMAGVAAAQVVVTSSGYATLGGPGVVPAPVSPPLVNVPQISFIPASPAPVGASNATTGNLAGASNSTLDNVSGGAHGSSLIPVYSYGTVPGPAYAPPVYMPWTAAAGSAAYSGGEQQGVALLPAIPIAAPPEPGMNLGIQQFATAGSEPQNIVASAGKTRPRGPMAGNVSTYTNENIARLNQQSGVTKPPGFTLSGTPENTKSPVK